MRNGRFALTLARREGRSALRRVGVYMASITLGVAALVAIHSFRGDVARSLEEQARVLMGADARLAGSRPLPDSLAGIVDSLVAEGARKATVTTAVSMVLAPRSDRVRLLQVRAVDGEWPFYGGASTSPAGLWGAQAADDAVLVDPAILTQLDVSVGDSLTLGSIRVPIAGTVGDLPTDLGFQTAVGPRVWISDDVFREAGLLGFGSLARYETYFRFPAEDDAGTVWVRYGQRFRAADFRFTTSGEQARELTDALDFLSQYLGLVGLGALLLGGVGVASAIHVYVKEKLTTVAVLRCIGAGQWTVFDAYLLQAAALGLAGAVAGVALGVATQYLLPGLLAGALPVEVDPRISGPALLGGLGMGLGVAVLFALPPLLSVRNVPPLRALRQDVEPAAGVDPWRVCVYLLLALAVTGLAVLEAPSWTDGLAFAGGLTVATGALWLTARLLIGAIRRLFPASAPYTLRQGLSNLFRPRNQTVAVTLALGFGAFVVGTVLQLQSSLAGHIALDADGGRPNVLLFDVQPDQLDGVLELLPAGAREGATVTPVVPARIASIGGRTPDELRADVSGPRPARWALRREYRHTYRSHLTEGEEVVAGRWFEPETGGPGPARISVESDLAEDLRVGPGDRITWDVGGRHVPSVVTSLRRVEWNRFATNFFVVFEPGILEEAPQMAVVLARVSDDERRARLQRELVDAFPNVSALDLDRVQEAVDAILGHVDSAARFLALFSAVAGLVVLAGALTASRHQRVREGALLRTLGAGRRQVVRIVLAEYVGLGAFSALTGLLLSLPAAWLLTRGVFGIPFVPSAWALVVVWAGVTAVTVAVGMAGSLGVVSRPPLPVLRRTAE